MPRGKLSHSTKTNPNPNPNPKRGAIFLGDNCPDTKFKLYSTNLLRTMIFVIDFLFREMLVFVFNGVQIIALEENCPRIITARTITPCMIVSRIIALRQLSRRVITLEENSPPGKLPPDICSPPSKKNCPRTIGSEDNCLTGKLSQRQIRPEIFFPDE